MKDRIIKGIKARILSEYGKHQSLDWAEIAARKIYSSYEINLLEGGDAIEIGHLKERGWIFSNKDPYTGKPTWAKDKFAYTQDDTTITYFGSEFSIVKRKVTTIRELDKFIEVLSHED